MNPKQKEASLNEKEKCYQDERKKNISLFEWNQYRS